MNSGPWYDAQAFSRHFYHQSKDSKNKNWAKLAMGVTSIGIGATLSWDAIKHLLPKRKGR